MRNKLAMKNKFAVACLMTGTLVVPALIPALSFADQDADRSNPKAFVKDSVITTKIKAKLAKESFASMTQLKVDTDNAGMVWLSGTAATPAEADKAVSIARATEGVTSVKSEIVIKP